MLTLLSSDNGAFLRDWEVLKQRGWNLTAESEKRRIVVYMVVGPVRSPNEFEPQHRSHEQRCANCCKKAAYRSQGAKCSRRSIRGAKRTTRGGEKEDEEYPDHRQQRNSAVLRQHYQHSQQPSLNRVTQNPNRNLSALPSAIRLSMAANHCRFR